MLDRVTGIWLSHSTPKFPGSSIESFWPQSGQANGQTFICGTYSYATFKDIGLQLKYIHIKPFDSYIPESFYYELRCLLRPRCYPSEEPYHRKLVMTTLAGHKFVSYAKYGRLNDDLYAAVLNGDMGGDFYVKSWGKLQRALPSNCSVTNRVFNVRTVKLPYMPYFSITKDHSKWCVTKTASTPWTCIADMNREVSQESRGGGAVCTNNPIVWKTFVKLVNSSDPCKQPRNEL